MNTLAWRRPAGYLLGIWLLLGSGVLQSALAQTPSSDTTSQPTYITPRAALEQQLIGFESNTGCCPSPATPTASGRQADVLLKPLFTAERDSWPFEFISHTGQFALLAAYQPEHPRALYLSGGSMTLQALARQLSDPRIIRPFKDGYLLSYPVIVAADARFDVTGTSLYLSRDAGALIINRGALVIRDAAVESWPADQHTAQAANFRPYVLSWAGSKTLIENSQLSQLGYQAQLSTGVTLARHERQKSEPAAQLRVNSSRFQQMATSITAQSAHLSVTDSAFSDAALSELDILDSQILVRNSEFSGTTFGNSALSSIRIQGRSSVWLRDNRIEYARKAAIELEAVTGRIAIAHNHIRHTEGNGLLIRGATSTASDPVLILHNRIDGSHRSAIDAIDSGHLFLAGNILANSGEYALSLRNSALNEASHVVLLNNQLTIAGAALVRTERVAKVGFYGTHFSLSGAPEQVLAGDSAPFQAAVMLGLLRRECDLELARQPQQTVLVAYPVGEHQAESCSGELVSSSYW